MNLDSYLDTQVYHNILIYGLAGTRKTWWAGTAAEAYHPALFLDSDSKMSVLRNLSELARQRVGVLNIADNQTSVAKTAMSHFLRREPFYIGMDTRRITASPGFLQGENYMMVDPNTILQTPGLVLVCDSWTAVVWSIMKEYSQKNNIDLADAAKPDWDGYSYCGRLATWMMNEWKALPCHKIMIAHQTQYEKKKEVAAANGKTNTVTEWSRRQIVSTSNPHAMTIPKLFSEVIYAEQLGMGVRFTVENKGEGDALCTRIPPGKAYEWNEFVWPILEPLMGITTLDYGTAGIPLPLYEQTPQLPAPEGTSLSLPPDATQGVITPKPTAAAILNP